MVVSLRAWSRRLLFAVLLIILTLTMFTIFRLAAVWIRMPDPYAVPQGQAVKVFEDIPDAGGDDTVMERLRWFYVIGE